MARFSVKSDVVQTLLREALIPLYFETGSVASLAKLLNDALQKVGETRPLHPNRIHSLFSEDVDRGVNELTVELTQQALEALRRNGRLPANIDVTKNLVGVAKKAAPLYLQDAGDIFDIARRLGVPPAVLALAMEKDGGTHQPVMAYEPAATEQVEAPDWSYQDVAVARCLDALRRRPNGNIGLVLPTGAGKTRTALRIVLEVLATSSDRSAHVIWVTHRKTLKSQAYRELDKLVQSAAAFLPKNALELASRVTFAMVGEVTELLRRSVQPVLIVIDEAHHTAAESYRPIFEGADDYPVLSLTATPIRTDKLPIWIDEIAFTITYRELAERRAIIVPKFEPFPVEDFNWSEKAINDLADRLLQETQDRFSKTLVLTLRIDQIMSFYEALVSRLESEPEHRLRPDDVGFIHGSGNSHGLDNDAMLAYFADKPYAVLVSAQMLLEGYDDPSIDAVVITYATESVIKLMQAAGRCVRYAPGKTASYVVQADNPGIAYRFDQRWLYQEIDDYLRPDLRDEDFLDRRDLIERATHLLQAHNVDKTVWPKILKTLADLKPGEQPRLVFFGLPYFGDPSTFDRSAKWGVFVETPENSKAFRAIFNGFSALGAELSDPTEYLAAVEHTFDSLRDKGPTSLWRAMVEILTAAYFAQQELFDKQDSTQASRPFDGGSTTWLHYVVFHHRPQVPEALVEFLQDCHNRAAIEAVYLDSPEAISMAVKTPLPLGGCEAMLLNSEIARETADWLDGIRLALRIVDPGKQLEEFARLTATRTCPRLPSAYMARAERWLSEAGRRAYCLEFTNFERG